jgi:hypothetical protein
MAGKAYTAAGQKETLLPGTDSRLLVLQRPALAIAALPCVTGVPVTLLHVTCEREVSVHSLCSCRLGKALPSPVFTLLC